MTGTTKVQLPHPNPCAVKVNAHNPNEPKREEIGHKVDDDGGGGGGGEEVPAAPLKSSLLASMGGHAFIFSRAASNCSWSKSKVVLTIFSGSPPRMSGVSPLPWRRKTSEPAEKEKVKQYKEGCKEQEPRGLLAYRALCSALLSIVLTCRPHRGGLFNPDTTVRRYPWLSLNTSNVYQTRHQTMA